MGVLDGITMLELTRVSPGEYTGQLLADMGAEVIKIESPQPPEQGLPTRSALDPLNRNKRSLTLDLKHAEGRALLHRLAAQADVLLEGFRPGVAARLGCDWATLHALNPRLVVCAMSGYGQSGPDSQRPGHDLNFMAQSGALALLGEAGAAPAIPANLVADLGGASLHAALGIMFALFDRERRGVGRFVDIAYLDATVSLLAATPMLRQFAMRGAAPRRGENWLSGSYPYYAIYRCSDDKLLSVACTEPALWANFCRAIERPDLARHARRAEHVQRAPDIDEAAAREVVAALLATRDRAHWLAVCTAADACVSPLLEVDEAFDDPQLQHRGMVRSVDDGEGGTRRQFGPAIQLSGAPAEMRRPAPQPGEHSAELLTALGLDAAQQAQLRRDGVV